MIAVDTNIIVRLLTQDDERQYKKSLDIFTQHEVMIVNTVILETEWVLRFAYGFDSTAISSAFTKLFGLANIHLSDPAIVAQAIKWHLSGMDFADAFHLSQCKNVECFYTFDNKFIKKSKELSSCGVIKP